MIPALVLACSIATERYLGNAIHIKGVSRAYLSRLTRQFIALQVTWGMTMAAIDPQLLQACQTSPEKVQRVVVTLHRPASAERLAELRQQGLSPVPFQDTIFQGALTCDSIRSLGAAADVLEITSDREMKVL